LTTIYSTNAAATTKVIMPRTPAFILLAAPWKAIGLDRAFPLGLPEPEELAGDVPLAAGTGAGLPGIPLPGTLPEEALFPRTALAGAPLPDEALFAGAALAGKPLPDEAPPARGALPEEAPLAGIFWAGAPLLPEEAPLAGALLPDELVDGDPMACAPLSEGDDGLAVWLGLTGIGMMDIVKVCTGEAFAGAAGWLPPWPADFSGACWAAAAGWLTP
jgi:hypothetical protein